LALSRLFEEKLGKPFTKLNLNQLATELPLLLDELGITKTALINVEGGKVTFETGNYIFKDLCLETQKFQRTHETIGCPFSSAIACALAKASRKPVTIEKEEQNPNNVTTTIHYQILEE
jgi:hydroxymethylpyrimidine/phosphomethylpyrimidine kinase